MSSNDHNEIYKFKLKKFYLCCGITKAMGEKMIFYNLEQFRLIANSFESKYLFMMDNTMKSIFQELIS